MVKPNRKENLQENCRSTDGRMLVLQSWFVSDVLGRLCEAQRPRPKDFKRPFSEGLLLPILDSDSLAVLPLVLQHLLSQILFCPSGHLSLSLSGLNKELGAFSSSRKADFTRVFTILGGLRFVAPSAGVEEPEMLFSGESWKVEKGSSCLYLRPRASTAEVLSGCSDLAFFLHELRLGKVKSLHKSSPFFVKKSLWCDLTWIEKQLFLKIKDLLIKKPGLCSLDGSHLLGFSSLSSFMEGLGATSFKRQVHTLRKLMHKLGQHGTLAAPEANEYRYYGKEQREPSLLIKPSLTEEGWKESFLLRLEGAVASRLSWKERLFDLAFALDLNLQEDLGEFEVLSNLFGGKMGPGPVWFQQGALFLSGRDLFLEMYLRKNRGRSASLAPSFLVSPLYQSVPQQTSSKEELCAKYNDFSERLDRLVREGSIQKLIQEVSVFSPDALSSKPRLAPHIETNSVPPLARSSVLASNKKGSTQALEEKTGFKAQEPALLNQAMVEESLETWKVSSRKRYEGLMVKYFDSLDPVSKKLALEVQGRMKPVVFDRHFRHRLVDFIMKNPEAWPQQPFLV